MFTSNRFLGIVFLLLHLMITHQMQAQDYNSINYGLEKGMPTQYTKAIAQDQSGNMWIATDSGVVFFNGSTLSVARNSLHSRYIKDITLLNDGRILAATDLGLTSFLYDGQAIQYNNLQSGSSYLQNNQLHFPKLIYQTTLGEVWISEPSSVVRMHPGLNNFERYHFSYSHHSSDYTRSFRFFEYDGTLYLTSRNGGLFAFIPNEDQFKFIGLERKSTTQTIDATLVINSKLYWGGDSGFYSLDLSNLSKSTDSRTISTDHKVTALHFNESSGYILIGTQNRGIYKYNPESGYISANPLNDQSVQGLNNIFEDQHGTIWTSGDQGTTLFYKSLFSHVQFDRGTNYINSLIAGDDVLFALTDDAVYSIEPYQYPGKFTPVLEMDSYNYVSAAIRNNELWIGQTGRNLLRVTDNGTEHFLVDVFDSQLNFDIFYIYADSENNLWILQDMHEGLIKFSEAGKFQTYSQNDGISTRITSVNQHPDGTIYAGGNGLDSYLFRKKPGESYFQNFSPEIPELTESFFVHDITFRSDGEIFLATDIGILHVLEDSAFQINHSISASRTIIFDAFDNLWVGTEEGIILLRNDDKDLFDVVDGLPSNTISYRSALFDRDGALWVGTSSGLGYMQDTQILQSHTPTPQITRFTADGTSYPIKNNIRVSTSNIYEIHYSSLIYPSEMIVYQAVLKNASGKVVDISTQRNAAIIRNLQTGLYQFTLTAKRKGAMSSDSVQFSFVVTPPWYGTFPAFVFYILLLSGFTYFVFKYRRNLSQRKLAQADLQNTSEQLGIILDNMPVVLFSINKNGYFKTAVGWGLQILELETNQVVGKHVSEIYEGDDVLEEIKAALKGKEVRYNRRMGEYVLETKVSPLFNPDGTVKEIIGVAMDITDRMRAEEKLIEAKNAAEQANLAKSTFLANMSHELRTPLNAIIGFAQVLMKQDTLAPTEKNYVEIMYQSGNHLLSMINDILDISKIEAGKLDLQNHRYNLHAQLEDLQSMLGYKAAEKGLTFNLKIASDVPHYVIADQNKIRQILINLISNAVKYSDKGQITLTVENRHSSNESDHLSYLYFSVRDTGRGIPEEKLDAIFNPFFQVNSETDEGTGLGLTITRRLAEIMGAEITVDSKVDEGTTFHILLPYESTPQTEAVKLSKLRVEIKGIKNRDLVDVLIVDDVEANRQLITAMMDFIPEVRVFAVSDGKQAMDFCKNGMPDLVIMDIVMPVMDGKEALREIRNLPNGLDPVIIAITAGGLDGTREELLQLGFDDFIRKPVYEEELLNAMKEQLDLVWRYHYGEKPASDLDTTDEIVSLLQKQDKDWLNEFSEALLLTDTERAAKLVQQLDEHSELKPKLKKIIADKKFRLLLSISEKIS